MGRLSARAEDGLSSLTGQRKAAFTGSWGRANHFQQRLRKQDCGTLRMLPQFSDAVYGIAKSLRL
jgi:hypothetical protein